MRVRPGRPARTCPACGRTGPPAPRSAARSAAVAAAESCGQPISRTPRMRPPVPAGTVTRPPSAACRCPMVGRPASRRAGNQTVRRSARALASRGGHAGRDVAPPPGLLGAEPRVAGQAQGGVGTGGPHGDRRRAERRQRVLQERLGDRLGVGGVQHAALGGAQPYGHGVAGTVVRRPPPSAGTRGGRLAEAVLGRPG